MIRFYSQHKERPRQSQLFKYRNRLEIDALISLPLLLKTLISFRFVYIIEDDNLRVTSV